MPKLQRLQQRRTNLLVWVAAIICAIFAVLVIITGLVVFVGYMIIQPRIPYISITYAHLDKLVYNQYGQMDTEMSINVNAENDNIKAYASFYDLSFILQFHGLPIAELRAEPFDVPKNSTQTLAYRIPSSMIPLNDDAMEAIDNSLKQDKISFHLKGNARTRWKVGVLGSVKFWTHLSCDLAFFPSNGTGIDPDCSSKSG
ncbi:late embryogenesis abundant protein [Tasmannia lanceolata]|uniref:late embryogenesis abundant protein n=1 Tax=Tasmannia lanceolata TaxID=3420 RepID=UPI0040637B07